MQNRTGSPYKGSAQITREQFLFYEMRTTAKLMNEGLDEKAIIEKIFNENLFQYPTEKTLRQMARTCIRRLKALDDEDLIAAIAGKTAGVSKQICLYAMMRSYRIVWDFMITVIGEKYRTCDSSFGRMDVNVFFMRLQEQDDYVAGWSESTVTKLRQVLIRILVENGYLDTPASKRLNNVMIDSLLENSIRKQHMTPALAAFNCFL